MAQPVRVCNLFVSWLVARRDEAELRHPAGVDDFLPFQTAGAPHVQAVGGRAIKNARQPPAVGRQDYAALPRSRATRPIFQNDAAIRPGRQGVVGHFKPMGPGNGRAGEGATPRFETGCRTGRRRVRTAGRQQSQGLGRGIQGAGQTPLDIRPKQARPTPGLVQAPTLAGHLQSSARLGLGQAALATQGGERQEGTQLMASGAERTKDQNRLGRQQNDNRLGGREKLGERVGQSFDESRRDN